MAAPWRTIAKLNTVLFQPGDRILLDAGSTRNESFTPKGNGFFDSATFDAVFASTLATQQAYYTANGNVTALSATYQAAGELQATADTGAAYYWDDVARDDALRAAHAAAWAASNPITLTSYGVGARPKLALTSGQQTGIRWNSQGTLTGGWIVDGIDIDGATCIGMTNDLGVGTATPTVKGLKIARAKISNCTGGIPVPTSGASYPGKLPPYTQFCASALTLTSSQYVWLDDVELDHCDAPGWFWGGRYVWVRGLNAHHHYIAPFTFGGQVNTAFTVNLSFFQDSLIENSEFSFVAHSASPSGAGPGYQKGEAGLSSGHWQNVNMRGVSIHDITLRHSDAVAFDDEGHGRLGDGTWSLLRGSFTGCTFGPSDGPALYCNDTVGVGGGMMIVDSCTIYHAGSPTYVRPLVFVARTLTPSDPWYFFRNTCTRGNGTQKRFGGDATNVYTPVYDATPAGKSFGPSNTVS